MSATAVSAAAAVEASTAATDPGTAAAAKSASAAAGIAADPTANTYAAARIPNADSATRTIAIAGSSAIAVTAAEPIPATEPGPGTDKEPAAEPTRPIIPIRCARIRSVVIIAIGAGWRTIISRPIRIRPHANPYRDLRMRECRRQTENRE